MEGHAGPMADQNEDACVQLADARHADEQHADAQHADAQLAEGTVLVLTQMYGDVTHGDTCLPPPDVNARLNSAAKEGGPLTPEVKEYLEIIGCQMQEKLMEPDTHCRCTICGEDARFIVGSQAVRPFRPEDVAGSGSLSTSTQPLFR